MPKGIPVKSMIAILKSFAYCHKLTYRFNRMDEILECYYVYNDVAKKLN